MRQRVQRATATTSGTSPGKLTAGAEFVIVTSPNVNNIITLPYASPGVSVRLKNGATGYELRSHAPATVGINGGVGVAAEAAIAATMFVECTCTTGTAWVCRQTTAAGVISATEVAAP